MCSALYLNADDDGIGESAAAAGSNPAGLVLVTEPSERLAKQEIEADSHMVSPHTGRWRNVSENFT